MQDEFLQLFDKKVFMNIVRKSSFTQLFLVDSIKVVFPDTKKAFKVHDFAVSSVELFAGRFQHIPIYMSSAVILALALIAKVN